MMNDCFVFNNTKFITGDKITCSINTTKIEDGRIYICSENERVNFLRSNFNSSTFKILFFVCQNRIDRQYNGFICPNLFGYTSAYPTAIRDNGYLCSDIMLLRKTHQNIMLEVVEDAFKCKELIHA